VRFLNASRDFGIAYLYLDDAVDPTITIPPLVGSPWGPIDAGEHELTVVASGQTPATGTKLTLDLAPEKYYTVWVVGSSILPEIDYAEDPRADIPVGWTRYGVYNAAYGYDPIGVGLDAVDTDVGFGAATIVELEPSYAVLRVDLDEDGAWDWKFEIPPIGANAYVPLFVTFDLEELVLLGASPQGGSSLLAATPVAETADTGAGAGDTADTSDTGS
jgi:hypothetical protein